MEAFAIRGALEPVDRDGSEPVPWVVPWGFLCHADVMGLFCLGAGCSPWVLRRSYVFGRRSMRDTLARELLPVPGVVSDCPRLPAGGRTEVDRVEPHRARAGDGLQRGRNGGVGGEGTARAPRREVRHANELRLFVMRDVRRRLILSPGAVSWRRTRQSPIACVAAAPPSYGLDGECLLGLFAQGWLGCGVSGSSWRWWRRDARYWPAETRERSASSLDLLDASPPPSPRFSSSRPVETPEYLIGPRELEIIRLLPACCLDSGPKSESFSRGSVKHKGGTASERGGFLEGCIL